jgi:hypothetical protein
MQKRGFLLLLATTIVLVATAAYAVMSGPRAVSTAAPSQRVFPDLASRLGDLAWMRLSRGQTKTDFTSVGGRWVLVEKGNYPAAPAKVRQLLLGLAELTLVEPKTAKTELFGRLDLDDPSIGKSTLITLRDRTGTTVAELIVGKVRRDRLGGGADGVYIRKPNENRTWLARGSFDLPDGVAGWLDRRILDIPPARIASVTLAGGDGPPLVLKREAPAGKFAVADPPDGATFKPDALAEPAGALAGFDLDDVKPAAELARPDSGVATAEFATLDGLTAKLRIVTQDGVDWVTVEVSGSGAAEADGKAINDKVARWAYAIPAHRAKLLRTRLADLTEPAKG